MIIEVKTGGAARSASQILKDIEIGKGNYTISPGGNIRDLDPKIQAQLLGGLKIPTKVATIDPLFKK